MSSKGKTPWITYNGVDVADSQFCIEYLNKQFSVDLNKDLSSVERSTARAFQKMTEEHLYWYETLILCKIMYRACQSRDVVLAVQSTGDLGCVYACVKNRFLFCFWVCSHN